jgi:hypothetical protein
MSDFRLPPMPRLLPTGLPEEEKHGVWLVQSGLDALNAYVQDFAAALALFDFATATPNVPQQWALIAARDGALTVYHFYDAFDGIRKTARAGSTLERLVDWSQFKAVERLYRACFPEYVNLRDSIGHAGDKMATPELFSEHSYTGGADSSMIKAGHIANLTMTNCLSGRTFTNTWESKILSYEVSEKTLGKLTEARDLAWSAFRVAEAELRKAAVATWSAKKTAEPSKPDEP